MKQFSTRLFVIFVLLFAIIDIKSNPFEALKNRFFNAIPLQVKPVDAIALMSITADLDQAKPIINKLKMVVDDDRIKGLIIHIDCWGGRPGTSEAIYSELRKVQFLKPVVVCVENSCLSGAYHIAVAADYIFALPSSEVGSIGVIQYIRKFSNITFNENNLSGNMEPIMLRAGSYKDLTNPYTAVDSTHIDYCNRINHQIYMHFVRDVAQCRNLSLEDEKIWADGKEFVGSEALELGLIDALGDFSDALNKMKELIIARTGQLDAHCEIIEIT